MPDKYIIFLKTVLFSINMYKVNWKYRPFLLLIDTLGYALFFWRQLMPIKNKKLNTVLIIRLDHIGDVLLTTPVIRAIKLNIHGAKIDLLVRSFTKELIETNKYVNKVYILNPPWFRRETANFFNLIKFIIKNLFKYDLVIELHADPRNIILASLIGRKVIGYSIRGLGFLLNKNAKYDKKDKHNIERNLDVVRAIGVNAEPKLDIFLEKKDIAFAEDIIKKQGLKKIFCIVPGTGRINKFWLNEKWAELADCLIQKNKATIVFLGSADDKDHVTEIINKMKSDNFVNLTGKTSLRETAAIIKKSKLLVSPDTGAMHIAKALDIPLVALFGPVNPAIWGYNDEKSRSIYVQQNCSFCDLPECYKKINKNICMKAISVSEVISSIEKVI